VLELNPSHPVIELLYNKMSANADDPVIADYIAMLYDSALLAEGSPIQDPADFVKRVTALMSRG
jgi:molecular chaperone HtpG